MPIHNLIYQETLDMELEGILLNLLKRTTLKYQETRI